MTALAVRQRSPEWYEARRALVTASDIPVLMGLSRYRCEADLADEKLAGEQQPENVLMKIGRALEPVIAEEYERVAGKRIRRSRAMVRHPEVEWAAASLDATVIGEHRVVEFKRNDSSTRFADGIVPQDVEAQVAWQLGVTGYPVADIAVLTRDELKVYEQEANPALFDDLIAIASDFRRRLEAGGPFSRDAARIRRDHPTDDGTELIADAELVEAAHALITTRGQIAALEATEEALKAAIQARMADASYLVGPDFRATWKRTKDREETDWKSLAASLLRLVPETERAALVGLHSSVRPGFRPFRLVSGKDD